MAIRAAYRSALLADPTPVPLGDIWFEIPYRTPGTGPIMGADTMMWQCKVGEGTRTYKNLPYASLASKYIIDLISTLGTGDVTSPASSTDNAIARFNGTTGKVIDDSSVIIADNGDVTGLGTLNGSTLPAAPGTLITAAALLNYLQIGDLLTLLSSGVAVAGYVATADGAGGITWSAAGGSGINELTGDVTAGPGTGSQVATISNNAVTNGMLSDMADATFKGRDIGAGSGDPQDLTANEASDILDSATDPFVRTSNLPPGGGDVYGPGAPVVADNIVLWSGTSGQDIKDSGLNLSEVVEEDPGPGVGLIESGIGVSPIILKNAADGVATEVQANTGSFQVDVRATDSIVVDGLNHLALDGDDAAPGNSYYYGTDGGGVKGFHALPSSSGITELTGDVTAGPGSGSQAATLASVITAGGPTGSATVTPIITYDAKGRLTTVSSATVTPAIGSVTGLGTGIATALAVNVGTAGAPVINGGALGTPSSGTLTNATGLPANGGLTGQVPIANGGTSASTEAGARTALLLDRFSGVQTGDQNLSSTTLTDITSLSGFSLEASATYHFLMTCNVTTNATGVGILITVNASGAVSSLNMITEYPTSATAWSAETITALQGGTVPTSGPGATARRYQISGQVTTSGAVTFSFQFRSEDGSQVTVKRGSSCLITRVG